VSGRARLLCVSLLAFAAAAFPLVAAGAGKGDNNRGGSDRSEEVRQDDHDRNNDGGGHNDGVTEDNDSDGVPNNVPDDGDNRHPSGRDRSIENGNSGNQGNSPSDPDGMSNGGADKPGGTGGIDQMDQDGNNGCGNDDDFEDDNNGLCLGQKPEESSTAPEPAPVALNAVIGGVVPESPRTTFAPMVLSAAPYGLTRVEGVTAWPHEWDAPAVQAAAPVDVAAPDETEVLAASITRPASARVAPDNTTGGSPSQSGLLPLTGRTIAYLVAAGLSLIAGGRWAISWRRRRFAHGVR
jgi:hypothetical protein